jgi:hypothetical protein
MKFLAWYLACVAKYILCGSLALITLWAWFWCLHRFVVTWIWVIAS